MKRRTMILSTLGVAGALIVGWGVLPARSRLGSPDNFLTGDGAISLNGWIQIAPDGSVGLAMNKSEMGQGIFNALMMLVAEELNAPMASIYLHQAAYDGIYGNVALFMGALPLHPVVNDGEKPFIMKSSEWLVGKVARELGINATGGSTSVADSWLNLRYAAATAKASLLMAASKQWNVPAKDLQVINGKIISPGGKSAHFGDFAKEAAALTPYEVTLKDRKNWEVIGRSAKRVDIPSKTDGSAIFGIDIRLPNMLYATIVQAPMMGGSVRELDTNQNVPGLISIVPLKSHAGSANGFAVVGKTTWDAMQGSKQVKVQWAERKNGAINTDQILQTLHENIKTDSGFTFYKTGDTNEAEKKANNIIEASYSAPYLAHATLEPMNCTVQVKDGQVDVWVPTQIPGLARAMAAKIANVPVEKVNVHVTLLGGGFGRRLELDFVSQAVQVAMVTDGKPVQLTWSREQDMANDFYRPMQATQLKAALNEKGQVQSLRIISAGDAITPRWMERVSIPLAGPIDAPDKTASEGLFDFPYAFTNQHISHIPTHMGVPIGYWRSVGHSQNAFFLESFIDELAYATQQDPLAFRESLLTDAPRYLAVLQLAAKKANWGGPLPSGHARGIALHESFGSIVAEVVEASIQNGKPQVHRVVCAIDCGTVINPNTVAQQIQSSVNFGLTAALYGKIDIKDGVVQQTNFNNYPILSMSESPQVETWIVPSTRAPAGVGEPGVPPIAPALSNALFALTGNRIRKLPLLA
ncbi:xanthine dehydrogenase family protein molybdopterin-binding subunit [Polynucleobacter sp. AP-Nickl1-40-C4]|uniref:xanthine dehydrogenase family protein molybdopterin-binding subunit n=1 Tax=Polynucleobacter sp. AP-Nickl1-40-C4 TaxID=3108275 RepID=UPI002B22B860|nr:molybdopterin cofactor-binding domain-containing protein [Polynucleobacter sp. AP-Nickl1-40-C4]MEA9567582.1 molybdopterin cofactor-binding domain-containing protein [Polynucleobacter sp. AP-Nickl1-40-C4]